MLALRAAAILLATAAIFDPAWPRDRQSLPNVRVIAASDAVTKPAEDRVTRALAGIAAFDPARKAEAVVLIGGRIPPEVVPDGTPLSIVRPLSDTAANVSVTAAEPERTLPGWTARFRPVVRGRGVASRTTVVFLRHRGAELAHVEHRWTTDDEWFEPELTFVPPEAGALDFTIEARPIEGEATDADNRADVRLLVEARTLKVLAYEPRPSWSAAFLRRALESDPLFEIALRVRASRGIDVTAGRPPDRLTAATMAPYDLVAIGAPEELSAAEIEALDTYVRRRGGAVLFLPDRRPSGPYVRLVPASGFDEMLVDGGLAAGPAGMQLRASEIVIPRGLGRGVEVAATATRGRAVEPVVISWLAGAGRMMFSGALDAWRARGGDDGFGRFWRLHAADAARRSPRPIELAISPGVAAPGNRVSVRAVVRPDFLDGTSAVDARILGAGGGERSIRLWPGAEPGVFEAGFDAPDAGQYDVQVMKSAGGSADAILHVRGDADLPRETDPRLLAALTAGTGGVSVTLDDLALLEAHVRGMSRGRERQVLHPARSMWWAVGVIALLCAEWALRRRRGLA